MAESISSSKYKVPATLRPLLEAFARETLRSQPADLIEFGRTFFEALHFTQKSHPKLDVIGEEKLYGQFRSNLQQKLAARPSTPELPKQDPFGDSQPSSQRQSDHVQSAPPLPPQSQTSEPLAEQTSRSSAFQSPTHTVANSKTNTSRSKMQQVQQSHAGSSHNTGRASPTELAAATKIQALYRGHFVRNHPEKFGIDTVDMSRRHSNDHLNSADNKKDLKRHSVGGYTLENASPDDRAATKIQAEIRGFLARKHVEAMKQQNDRAATKIQAHIRGFLTRKKLDGVTSPSRSSLHSTKSDDIVH